MELVLALIMSAFIGGVAGYIGSLMLVKRMALTGGALGHLTLPGIALALLYGFDVSIGAFLFLVVGIILIWIFRKRSDLPMEAVTAVVFASSVSIAFLFLPQKEAVPALIGDVSNISLKATLSVLVISSVVFFIVRKIYPKMLLISISEDVACSEDIDVGKYEFVYLTGIALTVAMGVRVVGSLLTAALVAIPAATSKNLSRNQFQYSLGSLGLGALAGIFGVILYDFIGPSIGGLDVGSPGPFIIIVSACFFLVSLVFRR